MSNSSVYWQIEQDVAKLRCGPLEARVESNKLGDRFVLAGWNGIGEYEFNTLGAGRLHATPTEYASLVLHEHYVRGQDYVLVLNSTLGLTHELYWRASFHETCNVAQIELIYSTHTDRLDSDPEFDIYSSSVRGSLFHTPILQSSDFRAVPKDETWLARSESDCHLLLVRNESLNLSYAEMVHPTDLVTVRILPGDYPENSDEGGWMWNSTLFPDRLEKGVIRRGRVCGWFMPAENDLEVAVELAKQFVAEPLPLTT